MTSTACDDQSAPEPGSRESAIESMALDIHPHEWRQGGHMRYLGHLVTWGEYIQRRKELIDEPRMQAQDELADAWDEARTETGRKFDGGKPRWNLLLADMPEATEEVVQVLTAGAIKYAARNWAQVENAQARYLAAGMRHEVAIHKGETQDPETGRHHLAHKICCDLFRLQLLIEEETTHHG